MDDRGAETTFDHNGLCRDVSPNRWDVDLQPANALRSTHHPSCHHMQAQIEQLLSQTFVPNSDIVKDAELRLDQISQSHRISFLGTLLVIIDTNPNPAFQLVASIVFKNVISKAGDNWHMNANNDDVENIRKYMFHLLHKPQSPQVVNALGAAFGFLAKYEYPAKFPNLIQLVMTIPNTHDTRVKYQSYTALGFIIDQLKSRKLIQARKAISEISLQIFKALFLDLSSHLQLFKSNPIYEHVEIFHTCQRISQKMVTSSLLKDLDVEGSPSQSAVTQYIGTMTSSIPEILTHVNVTGTDEKVEEISTSICDSFCSFGSKYSEKKGPEFTCHIRTFLEFYYALLQMHGVDIQSANRRFEVPTKSIVSSIIFIHDILGNPAYREDRKGNMPKGGVILRDFFSKDTCSSIVSILINKYMILTNDDVEEWNDNPEAYANQEIKMDWMSSPKSASDVTFTTMIRKFPHTNLLISNMLSQLQQQDGNFLLKEVCYWCVSLCYHELKDIIEFQKLFIDHLRPDVLNPDPNYKMVRRRVCQIMENWSTSINALDPTVRSEVFETLLCMLQPQYMGPNNTTIYNDYVVRLSAAIALKNTMDDFDFQFSWFVNYIERMIVGIVSVVEISTEAFTSFELLNVISDIAVTFGGKVRPYVDTIITSMLSLWKSYNKENSTIVKSSIFGCWKKLAQVLKNECGMYYHYFIPAILYATDVEKNKEDSLFLMKESLTLWLELLRQAPVTSIPDESYVKMMELYPRILQLMYWTDFEHMFTALNIISVYFFKYRQLFLKDQSHTIVPVLSATLYIDPSTGATRVGRVDVAAACKMIDGMAIFLNGQHTEFLEPLYTYFLTTVLTQKSSKEESAVPPDVLSFYVTSLARYALVAQQKFLGLFTKINGLDAAQAFETFLAVWTVKIAAELCDDDLVRVNAFGLASLLNISSPSIANNFGNISMLLSRSTPIITSRPEENQFITALEREIFQNDPALTLGPGYIGGKLREFSQKMGNQDIFKSVPTEAHPNLQILWNSQ